MPARGPASVAAGSQWASNDGVWRGASRSSTTTPDSPAPVSSERSCSASSSENGPGMPGRRYRQAGHSLTASTAPRARGFGPWSPYGDRDPPARVEHALDLARRRGGIDREHQALATEHDVVGVVRLVDLFEIEDARCARSSSRARQRVPRDGRHLDCDVGQHDVAGPADELGRRQTRHHRGRTRARARGRPVAARRARASPL